MATSIALIGSIASAADGITMFFVPKVVRRHSCTSATNGGVSGVDRVTPRTGPNIPAKISFRLLQLRWSYSILLGWRIIGP